METTPERLFVDTGYLIARFNVRDQYHARARALDDIVARCHQPRTTDAVLLEFAAACSPPDRRTLAVIVGDNQDIVNGCHGCELVNF
jgi:predicted nucleic acid-binding protein